MKNFCDRYLSRPITNKPTRIVLIGYSIYVLLTWVLLCLPISWESDPINPLDNLFIATSAISTTGLITVNTPEAYSFFGELIVACAFQIGGIGYMTLGSVILLSYKKNLPSINRDVSQTVFSIPNSFNVKTFLKHAVIFTVLSEILGFIGLYIAFSSTDMSNPLWAATFHSISAFCTAGFSIFPDSLIAFRGNVLVNVVVTVLSLLGAIGFIVASDVWLSITSRHRITLTTKIIVYATLSSIIFGWIFLFFAEPSIAQLSLGERFLASGFQSMTAMTTVGFNSHPIEALTAAPLLIMVILMVIGASPSGTGGGLKTTTISTAVGVLWASLRGQKEIMFFRRRISIDRILEAFAALVFYVGMFLVGSLLLLLFQGQAFEDVIFEAASALGTVGLSRGITGDLTVGGKVIVILLMFVGRVGPITFGLALFKQTVKKVSRAEEDIAI